MSGRSGIGQKFLSVAILSVLAVICDGAAADQNPPQKLAAISSAMEPNDLAEIRVLIANGAYVEVKDKEGRTPLGVAANRGYSQIVRLLRMAGADVNAAIPLLTASQGGHDNVVKLLLKAGAGVDAADNYGSTSLFFASRAGHVETVKLLLKHKANVNVEASFLGKRFTPLSVAEYSSYDNVVKVLR